MTTQGPLQATLKDEDLVAAAREGDRAAFDILAQRYRPGVMAVTLDMTRRLEVARDLTQDALLVAWERLGELRDPGRFAPWLRTIAANRARMWLRRPVTEIEAERVPEPEVEDVAALVRRRELERALRQSLLELPTQNRLALLMHCLSGASYAEIAAFLEVPETTIEGRIYRARQHLRRHVGRMLDEAEPWRQSTMTHDTDFDRLVRLSSWARRMGAMLGAGVCLLRALRVAEQAEEDEAFRAALQDLGDRVEQGETLSAAMRRHPEAFGDLAVAMVRAGEYGGVLDETVEAWADLLRRDIELGSRARLYRLLARTAEAAGVQSARDWEARLAEVLARSAPTARLASYCYALGTMLQAGVPFLQSLEVAAEFLSPEEAESFLAARAAYRDACSGEQVTTTYTAELCARAEIPSAVKQLFAVGEETGLLDRMALRAAEMLRWEVESRVDAAMELCLAGPEER